jgi:hypothetical protein
MKSDNLKAHTVFFDKARFKHPEFTDVMEGIAELIKCGGTIPIVNCLAGPSRVGKSVVIEQICKQYGIDAQNEEQPIVTTEIEPKSTPKMIVESLLEAMGVKPKGNIRALRRQLNFLAEKKGVRLFIIDETQHAMPKHQNSSDSTQVIADILKLITDATQASILLVGLEDITEILQNKFKKNKTYVNSQEKQMIGRSFPPIYIHRIKLQQKNRFMSIMKGYQHLFNLLKQNFGITAPNVEDKEFALRLWVACKGYFGRLRFLFAFSIEEVEVNGEVTLKILAKTYDKVINEKVFDKKDNDEIVEINPFTCNIKELKMIAKSTEHLEALSMEGK